jgi:flagella basal body P-ring formation protein FlgA
MRTRFFMASLLCGTAALPCPATAALLRPFSQITAGTIRLGDLFDNLGTTPDRVLGHAPAPGARIIVGSPQLAAIARDFNVDWRPQTGGEQAVVERRGDLLSAAKVSAAVRRALIDGGAPAEFDVASPDIQPILLPVGESSEPVVSQISYDPQAGRFTAQVSVGGQDSDAVQLRVSGQVIAMARAVVATARLAPGSVIRDSDVRMARVRAALLHGASVAAIGDVVGMAVRHDVPAGQVLGTSDLARPAVVQRGALVRMSLDTEGLALSAQGVAMEAGGRGERIHVENPVSHQVVLADITGPGEVRVAPRSAIASVEGAQ